MDRVNRTSQALIRLLPFFVLSVCIIQFQPPRGLEDSIDNLHGTLVEFHRRGQLALELFPPLSLIVSKLLTTSSDILNLITLWLLAFMFSVSYASIYGDLNITTFTLSTLSSVFVVLNQTPVPLPPLVVSGYIADGIILLVLLATMRPLYMPETVRKADLIFGVKEFLVVIALAFGYHLFDGCTCYILILVSRLKKSWEDLRDPKKPLSCIFTRAILTTSRWLLYPLLISIVVYATVLPASETAAGGNYNLHFLAPDARRYMTFSKEPTRSSHLKSSMERSYGILAGTPLSIYLPRAGFLWSDELVWLDEDGFFDQVHTSSSEVFSARRLNEQHSANISGHRVFLADKIARRYPWQIQPFDSHSNHLYDGEPIFLKSLINNRAVCVQPEKRTVTDSELGLTGSGDIISRMRLTASLNITRDCIWQLQYNPNMDLGFSLYHPKHDCHIATTFRTFPDYDGERGNDTVARILNLQLEAACTTRAKDTASRLFIIEGHDILQGAFHENSTANMVQNYLMSIYTFYYRGFWTVQALYNLQQFRSQYGSLQDMESLLFNLGGLPRPPRLHLVVLVCGLFIVIQMTRLTYLHRYPKACCTNTQTPRNELGLVTIYVVLHMSRYYIFLGAPVASASCTPALISLIGVLSLICG